MEKENKINYFDIVSDFLNEWYFINAYWNVFENLNTGVIVKRIAILLGNISRGAGTERAVINLANLLVTNGNHDVTILSIFSLDTMEPYFNLNEKVKIVHLGLKNDSILNRIISYKRLISRVNKLIKREAYNFLLGTTHAFNCLMVCMSRKVKKIACEHMVYTAAPVYSRIVRRLAYPKLDAVVLLTENDRKNYAFCKKTFVIPNSVPQMEESAACENKILLGVGRYTKQKGFDMLIKAFSLVHEQIPEWKLRIVGRGEDEELLDSLIEVNLLQNKVELVPPTKYIRDEYLRAEIFVLSSRWEGFGLVLAEAKAAGLPSISFKCPEGPADILSDGKDGFLVEPENIEELGKYIVQLARDEKLRKQFGQAAKEGVKRLSPEAVFQSWDGLFNDFPF